jgi:hypothetical protein
VNTVGAGDALLGWVLVVCTVQVLVISGGDVLFLFAVTHGWTVLALGALTRNLRDRRGRATEPLLVRDHASLRATWRQDGGSSSNFRLEGISQVLVHAALLGSGLFAWLANLSSPAAWGWAALVCGTWTFTGARLVRVLRDRRDGFGEVELLADLDRVQVTEGARRHHLPLHELDVSVLVGDLQLSTPDQALSLPCRHGAARDELVDALRVMVERAVPAHDVPQPAALARMRAAE